MEVVNLYYDEEKTKKIGEEIDFGIVEAGREEERIIYIQNELPFKINLTYELKKEDKIELISSPDYLDSKRGGEIKFKIKTKLLEMKPLRDIISIKASWIVS